MSPLLHFFLLFLALAGPKPDLNLTILPDKNFYRAGEAIQLNVTLKNNGNTRAMVDGRLSPGEVTILVTGPEERPVPFQAFLQSSGVTKNDLANLGPGDSITVDLPLSRYFRVEKRGAYLVQAVYDTIPIDSRLGFWRGKITSSTAIFTIKENDAQASQSLAEAQQTESSFLVPGHAAVSDLHRLQKTISDGSSLYRRYLRAPSDAAKEELRNLLAEKWNESVSLALSSYSIPLPSGMQIEVDPDGSYDWMLGANKIPSVGPGAFQSIPRLAASLSALNFILENLKNPPVTGQDYQLCMALIYQGILSRSKELGLTADDITEILKNENARERGLDRAHQALLSKKEWPASPNIPDIKAGKDAALYTPPFIRSSDRFFMVRIFSDGNPLPKARMLLAEPVEAGFEIDEQAETDSEGRAFFQIPPGAGSLLVVPEVKNGPFPQRILVLHSGGQQTTSSELPPAVSSFPPLLEPGSEEVLEGNNLLERSGNTVLNLGDRELAILAGSPSVLLTRIPELLPGTSEMNLATRGGAIRFHARVVNLSATLEPKTLQAGQSAKLTLSETGAESLDAFAEVDPPVLQFPDGKSRMIVELENKKPVEVQTSAAGAGKFKLVYGIEDSRMEKVRGILEGWKSEIRNREDLSLVDQTLLAFEEDHLSLARSSLEKLYWQTSLNEAILLPVTSLLR